MWSVSLLQITEKVMIAVYMGTFFDVLDPGGSIPSSLASNISWQNKAKQNKISVCCKNQHSFLLIRWERTLFTESAIQTAYNKKKSQPTICSFLFWGYNIVLHSGHFLWRIFCMSYEWSPLPSFGLNY